MTSSSYSLINNETGEKVDLQNADTPPLEDPSLWPPLLQDEAIYSSAWGAAGDGQALHRTGFWGNTPRCSAPPVITYTVKSRHAHSATSPTHHK